MSFNILVTEGDSVIGNSIYNERINLIFPTQVKWIFLSKSECNLKESLEDLFKSFTPDIVINLSINKYLDLDTLKKHKNECFILDMCKKYKIKRLINISQFEDNYINIGSKLLTQETETTVINLIHKEITLFNEDDNYNLQTGNVISRIIHKCYKAEKNNTNLFIKESGNFKFLYANDFANIILQFINLPLNSKLHSLKIPVESEISISDLVNYIVSEFDFKKLVVYDRLYSDTQISKTCSDIELLNYLPNFEFTPFRVGLQKTIKHFIKNYESIRK